MRAMARANLLNPITAADAPKGNAFARNNLVLDEVGSHTATAAAQRDALAIANCLYAASRSSVRPRSVRASATVKLLCSLPVFHQKLERALASHSITLSNANSVTINVVSKDEDEEE